LAGTITYSNFYENKASTDGGALDIYDLRGKIENSRFEGNQALGGRGGAIFLGSTIARSFKEISDGNGYISNNIFIGNQAADSGGAIWSGGASGDTNLAINSSSKWHLYTKDNTFLGNHANKEGAAITFGGNLHISGNTLFYGNKSDTLGYNSISIHDESKKQNGKNKDSNLYIGDYVTRSSNILIFDPIHKGSLPDTKLNVEHEYNNLYLGGENTVDYFRTRKDGTLTLTNVEYERGSGYTSAIINTNGLGIGDSGTLSGNGIINSSIGISGTVAPSIWSNTGKRANEIDRNISDADIKAIGVQQDSIYGHLTINGNVSQSGKTIYAVDITWNNNGKVEYGDWLNINGSWDNQGNKFFDKNTNTWKTEPYESILRIDSVSLPAMPKFSSDTEAVNWLQPLIVISTTKGINTDFTTELDSSISIGLPDYLGLIAQKDSSGNHLQVATGLSWNNGTKAHGNFTIHSGETFTVNSDLNRASPNSTWNGRSLHKYGGGTLILNGNSNYIEEETSYIYGTTIVEDGTLVIGADPSKSNALLHGSIQVNNGATLSGFGSINRPNYGNSYAKIKSGGTLAPGYASSIGTVSIYNLEFEKGSIYQVKALEDGQSDKIIIKSNIRIDGGTVDVRGGPGAWGMWVNSGITPLFQCREPMIAK